MHGEFLPLLEKYGYAATFVGTLLEGETFLLLSGLAAHRGLLDMPVLFVVSAAGAFVSDNFFFAMGRLLGPALLTRFPRLAPSAARANGLVERLPNTAVIGIRFLYGMRAVGPAVVGAGSMGWSYFPYWMRSRLRCGDFAGPAPATCSASPWSRFWEHSTASDAGRLSASSSERQ